MRRASTWEEAEAVDLLASVLGEEEEEEEEEEEGEEGDAAGQLA